MPYSLRHLIADVERASANAATEADLIAAVEVCAAKAIGCRDTWFDDSFLEADEQQGYSLHLLYEHPDHSLAIFALSWLPGRGAPPHDHGTWAVIGGISGQETHLMWDRRDDRSRPDQADITPGRRLTVAAGGVISIPAGGIHSVSIDVPGITSSLHIYGRHINFTDRYQFDPTARTALRWQNKIEDRLKKRDEFQDPRAVGPKY